MFKTTSKDYGCIQQRGLLVISYKKNQAVFALWSTLVNPAPHPSLCDAPAIFKRRFDKLLSVGVPLLKDERAGKPGQDNQFTADQVFLMGVALVLIDSGLGLGAAGFFIYYARKSLQDKYHEIMRNAPFPFERNIEDRNVYLLFQNRDIQEFYPNSGKRSADDAWSGKGQPPLIINPKYASGRQKMHQALDGYLQNGTHNHVLVIELAMMAKALTDNLEKAPVVKRGRQK
ncbi:hypothetical protein AD935_05945 [Gluconobacter japonicus]|nr:hypothetical protein AD935_05945 [Gluconobacter japonicus]